MTRLTQFANNAVSKLASSLSAVGLTISVTPGEGSKFPSLTAGQFFMGTLVKADGTKEVVKVTARSTDTMTIVRAAEAVAGVQTAYAFLAGDAFELRMTAGMLGAELDRLDAAAFVETATKTANYTVLEADISKLIKVDTTSGNITVTLPQITSLNDGFEVYVSKASADANQVNVVRTGSDTINGATSYVLPSQYQSIWIIADRLTNTWTAINSGAGTNRVIDVFVGSGTAGPFTLSGDPITKNNVDVFVGGVYQVKADFTLAGTSLTLGGVVLAGVPIEVLWSAPLVIGTPSDGTVSTVKLADSAVTTPKIADSAVTTAKLAAVIAPVVSSINGGALAGLRNRIINGNFGVNQRTYVSGAAVGTGLYGHDRWKMAASADTYTFSTTANVTTVTIPASKVLQQVIEGANLESGTYTLSWTGTAQGKIGAGSYGASGITGVIVGGTNTTIEFGPGTVSKVQLEFGSTATVFEQRPIGMERSLCQRYFWRTDYASQGGTAAAVGSFRTSTTVCDLLGHFTVQMRAAPTMSVSAASTFNVYCPLGAPVPSVVGNTFLGANQFCFTLQATTAATIQGAGAMLTLNTGAFISASAEL